MLTVLVTTEEPVYHSVKHSTTVNALSALQEPSVRQVSERSQNKTWWNFGSFDQ